MITETLMNISGWAGNIVTAIVISWCFALASGLIVYYKSTQKIDIEHD